MQSLTARFLVKPEIHLAHVYPRSRMFIFIWLLYYVFAYETCAESYYEYADIT